MPRRDEAASEGRRQQQPASEEEHPAVERDLVGARQIRGRQSAERAKDGSGETDTGGRTGRREKEGLGRDPTKNASARRAQCCADGGFTRPARGSDEHRVAQVHAGND
jgi:hypothetical protein